MMLSSDKLYFFHELISLSRNICLWEYDTDMKLRSVLPADDGASDPFSEIPGARDSIFQLLASGNGPVIATIKLGLVWVFSTEIAAGSAANYYALGPFLLDDDHFRLIDAELSRLRLDPEQHKRFSDLIRQLPVIGFTRILEYGIMLHYCLTGERVEISDFLYWDERPGNASKETTTSKSDHHGTWAAERRFLNMIREGNLQYREAVNKLASTGRPGTLSKGDPGRQLKNLMISSVVLCSRAAMEGGLSSEIAYSLSDHYIQSIEACTSMAEIVEINDAMISDYVHRVHNNKVSGSRSASVRECCDYISLHIEDKLTVHDVASFANYTDFYFGRKFKEEMGISAKEYIALQKIERAKELLTDTRLSIGDISESLSFSSQSYFTEQFRRHTGMTPTEYRNDPH